jgi:hypothetical protein
MTNRSIPIGVEQANALTRPVDLLVLKYAQALYGLDGAAAERIGVRSHDLPETGHYLLADGRLGTAARDVLFIGVTDLYSFGYQEIRAFARKALSIARAVRPEAREIGLTLHGPGYGLDETEAFESEIAGLLDAMAEGEYPARLEKVTFFERNPGRAERLRVELERLLPGPQTRTNPPSARDLVEGWAAESLRSVGYSSGAKQHAFIAMPFAEAFEDIFHYGIATAVRSAGLLCERIDKVAFTGDIMARVLDRIGSAQFMVADLTGANPNVYLEVGYAWGRGVPTVLLCDKNEDLTFDIRGRRCLRYASIRDLESKLTEEIASLLPTFAASHDRRS